MVNDDDYDDQDDVTFEPEDEHTQQNPPLPAYKILIVDDEEEVHKITRLTLRNLVFDNHSIQFLSAYSLAESKLVFSAQDDIAVVLIDVVMETNSAGLDLVKHIRDELSNRTTRIILRTGQPGAAPEDKVIIDYDINDYKSKTELTSQKLTTSVIACIRSFRDITLIDRNRTGLRSIVDSTSQLFDFQDKSLKAFLKNLLDKFIAIHDLNAYAEAGREAALPDTMGFIVMSNGTDYKLIAGTGKYEPYINQSLQALDDRTAVRTVQEIRGDKQDDLIFGDGFFAGHHKGYNDVISVLYMKCDSGIDRDLIRIFFSNMFLALDNFVLNRNVQVTQREIISTLSEIVEKRDMSTANHIKRVSEYVYVIGKNLGLDIESCKNMKIACMMHDVGKIGISDKILLKPASLTEDEFEEIKEHTSIGHRLLENSPLPIMKVAAEIALNHHERWDGSGYPNHVGERLIPLNARILSVLDVFDALSHKRIYKDPWTLEETLDYIRSQSGKMFDPELVDLFFESMDEILEIWNSYPDEHSESE